MEQAAEQAPQSGREEAAERGRDGDREQGSDHAVWVCAVQPSPAHGVPARFDRGRAGESADQCDARAHRDAPTRQEQRERQSGDAAGQVGGGQLCRGHAYEAGHGQRHGLAGQQASCCVGDEREGHRAPVRSSA